MSLMENMSSLVKWTRNRCKIENVEKMDFEKFYGVIEEMGDWLLEKINDEYEKKYGERIVQSFYMKEQEKEKKR